MKKRLQGFIAGALVGVMIAGGTALAVSTTTLYDVITSGVSIVMDGNKLIPRDANGNVVEPMIYNGTTYLPVRAISNAVGKAVYWDGPNYTVYLGDMDGQLEYPTVMLKDIKNISKNYARTTDKLVDNYGNVYNSALCNDNGFGNSNAPSIECLTGMQFSRFKGTLYVPEGTTSEKTLFLTITADDKMIYTSPQMTKSSAPIEIDVNITGYNNIKVEFSHDETFYLGDSGGTFTLCLADAGFYQ